jgi:hypothetical protein
MRLGSGPFDVNVFGLVMAFNQNIARWAKAGKAIRAARR